MKLAAVSSTLGFGCIALLLLSAPLPTDAQDVTTVAPGNDSDPFVRLSTGTEVTRSTVDLIVGSGIFSGTIFINLWKFLLRVAVVETWCGVDITTYSTTYFGGIWRVDLSVFQITLDVTTYSVLSTYYTAIFNAFGITWGTVVWAALQSPIYSALAFCLYWATINIQITFTIQEQAVLYVTYWRTTSTITKFRIRARVKGDPHMMQLISGSETPLCYDVIGKEGDAFLFLDDPVSEMVVSATLKNFGTRDKIAQYVGKLSVVVGDVDIQIDARGTTVDGLAHHWVPQTVERRTMTDDVHVDIKKNNVTIETSLTEVFVTRHPKCLNLDITLVGRVGAESGGILGDVDHRTQILEMSTRAYLQVTNANGTISRLPLKRKPHCWKLSNNFINKDQPFGELLTESKIDCLTC